MLDAGMRRLRDSLSRPQHEDGDLWDDGPLPDLTSGVMWAVTGLCGFAGSARAEGYARPA